MEEPSKSANTVSLLGLASTDHSSNTAAAQDLSPSRTSLSTKFIGPILDPVIATTCGAYSTAFVDVAQLKDRLSQALSIAINNNQPEIHREVSHFFGCKCACAATFMYTVRHPLRSFTPLRSKRSFLPLQHTIAF